MTAPLDDSPEAAAACARHLRDSLLADPHVLAARTGGELQVAVIECIMRAAQPMDATVERDHDDPRRVSIFVAPGPGLRVTAVVRR